MDIYFFTYLLKPDFNWYIIGHILTPFLIIVSGSTKGGTKGSKFH